MLYRYRLSTLTTLLLLLQGCASTPPAAPGEQTGAGTVIGGVTGAIIGHQLDRRSGALVGGMLGGVTGGLIGQRLDRQQQAFNDALAQERLARAVEVERVRDDLLRLTLESDVSFDLNSSQIRPSFRATLDRLAQVLVRYPQSRILIIGHTDGSGSDSYNLLLSERRANAVALYLTQRGVDTTRLEAQGAGESQPRADNATIEGRRRNRRVEILVAPQS